jgi:8-oxo-dGTP pyrophosphatase MutT (NUDIX family)
MAILAFIVNEQEELLLLSHPSRGGAWEPVNGGVEAGETILDAALRETYEEAGPIAVHPLGTVHVQTFHYDDRVRYMLSINYLLAYEGGKVQPGDDMLGSAYRWWNLDALADDRVAFFPPQVKWVAWRAVELYRLWKDHDVLLQPPLPA